MPTHAYDDIAKSGTRVWCACDCALSPPLIVKRGSFGRIKQRVKVFD